jgi:glycosyltransferase involved in cell wall biosynthesis
MKQKALRVGLDGSQAGFDFSGIGNYSRNFIKQIAKAAPENQYLIFSTEEKSERLENELSSHPQKQSLEWHGPKKRKSLLSTRTRLLKSLLKNENLDLYHGLGGYLPKGLKCPRVVTAHEFGFLRHPQYFRWIDRTIHKLPMVRSLKAADLIFAVSHSVKEQIVERFKLKEEKVVVTYQSCHERFRLDGPLDEKTQTRIRNKYNLPRTFIFTLATIEPRKNLAHTLEAFAEVKKHFPELKFVIAGRETPYLKNLLKTVQSREIESDVFYLSTIESEDLPKLYKLAQLFVYVPITEGFGLPVLEALSCGTPVLTASTGALPEITSEPTSILVNPHSVKSIENGLITAFYGKNLENMKAQIPSELARFQPDRVMKRVLSGYQRLL